MFSLATGNWRLATSYRRRLRAIAAREAALQAFDEKELRAASLSLRHRARSGELPRDLVVEAFALVREAGRRTIGLRHFDVQLWGGQVLVERGLAEMQTGEGKTLTATLPMYLFALYGRGAHLSTVNDYLARRDADLMRPVYQALGLTIGVVESSTPPDERRRAYAADITYGTSKEFGFDYLRDRLQQRGRDDAGSNLIGRLLGVPTKPQPEQTLQREPFFMLVDEADSVLIDDAGTPLIISTAAAEAPPKLAARRRFAAQHVGRFVEGEHYELDLRRQRVELTLLGREEVRALPQPPELNTVGLVTLYDDVERAILVERLYLRDRNYVVRDDAIAIVDEFTGRIAEGRKWRGGIHQAVEAKEGLAISDEGGHAARITVQDFFLRYEHLAGMSGTAQGSTRELRRIYQLRVAPIPTNRPPIRKQLATRIFGTTEAKWQAIVAEVVEFHRTGRPVLIGTRSIDKSEQLAELLRAVGIEPEVLNAHHEQHEAAIVARAGERGRVTVATNMAGRGTDVRLGPDVGELGGLHVVVTEMHDSARIDRQLVGRSGRQGDPGSYRVFLALDDDLLRAGFGPRRAEKLKQLGRRSSSNRAHAAQAEFPASYARLFHRAQQRVERRKFHERKRLLALEKQRTQNAQPLGLDPHLDLPG
jgi:preprotein translocase subunit SecA